MLKKLLPLMFLLVFYLPACTPKTAVPTQETKQGTPIPATPQSGKSGMVGTLIRKGTSPEAAYVHLKVYLGTLLLDSKGKTSLAKVDPMNAPISITDESGHFEFKDIEPGTYILAAQLPPTAIVKLKHEDGTEMLIKVEAGKVVDLGKLFYDFPFDSGEGTPSYNPYPAPADNTPYPQPTK